MAVGLPDFGEETPCRPSRRHSCSEGPGREGVGDYWCLPCEEGGAANGARASPVPDGSWRVVRRNGPH